jgi:hypothetical protein
MSMEQKKEFVLDLSNRKDMEFNQEMGICFNCNGKWPLLPELKWCKVCILGKLPLKTLGITHIMAPTDYKRNENERTTCICCFEKTEDVDTIITCTNCLCKYCDTCFNKLPKDTEGFTKCVHCLTNKLKITYVD